MQEAALNEIRLALARLVPQGVIASAGAIAAPAPALLGPELPPTSRMSPRRLTEFAAGRAHARHALSQLGLPSTPIPMGRDRTPEWPKGTTGSISHGGELVVAVVCATTTLRAIGIDVEPDTPLDDDLISRVCRPEELARLGDAPISGTLTRRAKLVFSAKESAYKCLAPMTGVFLEFEDLQVEFDRYRPEFSIRGCGRTEILVTPGLIRGAFVDSGGYWITVAWQPSRGDTAQD